MARNLVNKIEGKYGKGFALHIVHHNPSLPKHAHTIGYFCIIPHQRTKRQCRASTSSMPTTMRTIAFCDRPLKSTIQKRRLEHFTDDRCFYCFNFYSTVAVHESTAYCRLSSRIPRPPSGLHKAAACVQPEFD